jgi:hypothetical protein
VLKVNGLFYLKVERSGFKSLSHRHIEKNPLIERLTGFLLSELSRRPSNTHVTIKNYLTENLSNLFFEQNPIILFKVTGEVDNVISCAT